MKTNFLAIALASSVVCVAQSKQQPNVVIIITDDQGYGDLSFTGNPHLKTPFIDKFAKESVRMNNFYVCPVSSPTRSGLMTGRYSLRTGIRDTYNGGAMMAANEITVAEMLKDAGYTTGIFGKWHLGDNYPFRPNDQGFDESVNHLDGGMGQPGDITTYFKGDSSYFDPVLWHNGKQEGYSGYCTDIFADQAIKFIEKNHTSPFFCYLAFNAVHEPLQVPDKYYSLFKDIDPASGFGNDKRPFYKMSEIDKEAARRVYAMVTNLDENIGKVLKKLDDLKISENTLVIFMSDNGPYRTRYLAGMRGQKGSVYRGGIRVPCFIRYPGLIKGNIEVETNTAYIDIMPTIAEICHAELPKDRIIDGKNLLPLIKGENVDWKNRSLFFYWTRRYPELYNNIALQKGSYKLVGHTNYNEGINGFELFDVFKDPYEQSNIIKDYRDIAKNLKIDLDIILKDLVNSPNLVNQPRIIIGNEHENPVFLNRTDAYGERGWAEEEFYGKWRLSISEGLYNIKFRFLKPVKANGRMILETGTFINQMLNVKQEAEEIEMKDIYFSDMECDFIPYYSVDSRRISPLWIKIEKQN
ncbi:MAG TPA: arylsulfatase [Bacteroidales bacterium]|nr:arylsulfatase [Bacteroidales bacterium]